MESTSRKITIASPFLIILVNFGLAFLFKPIWGKWTFIPMILIGWALWLFFILKLEQENAIQKWLQKPVGATGWSLLAITVGLIPLPLFLFHSGTLAAWQVWLPWITLALINPWIEEFYWRGLLLDATSHWSPWFTILFSSVLFAINHAAFGINSALNSGMEIIISTLVMGITWSFVYKKTKSLRWTIFAHFLVDFFGLSAAAFLDLWQKGTW